MENNYKIIDNDPPENYKIYNKLELGGKIHSHEKKIELTKRVDQILFNPKYVKFTVLPQVGVAVDAITAITVDNIAEFAYPLAQFIEQVKPDYIIACDRGARMIGLAVAMLYRRLYGPLPTFDHAIHFRKISRKVSPDDIANVLKPDIERMLAVLESPTVFVLDDWVNTGETKELTQNIFAGLSKGRVKLLYGVMAGGRADVSGKKSSDAVPVWHDKAKMIGVDYDQTLVPHKIRSLEAIELRKRMSESIRKFAQEYGL